MPRPIQAAAALAVLSAFGASVHVTAPRAAGERMDAAPVRSSMNLEPVRAFPGAEGGGAIAVGGRRGVVLLVSNLRDRGPGSLRACMEASGPRTCIFRVSGVIMLQSVIWVTNPYLTVAGQTAPGSGITITYDGAKCAKQGASCQGLLAFSPTAHDIVIRYLRLRHRSRSSSQAAYNVTVSSSRTILDHVSLSWAANDSFEINGAPSYVTLSWSIVTDGLRGHNTALMLNPEGAKDLEEAIEWDVHHTVSSGTHRIPKVGSKRARFVSNILHPLYTSADGRCVTNPFTGGSYDYIANFFKRAPRGSICEILPASESVFTAYRFYPGVPSLHLAGNVGPSDSAGTNNANLVYRVDPADDDEHPLHPLTVAEPGIHYERRDVPLPRIAAPITVDPVGSGGAALAARLWAKGHDLYGPVGASRRLDCGGRFVEAQDLFDRGVRVRYENNTIFSPADENDAGYESPHPERRVNGVATTWADLVAYLMATPSTPCADADSDGIPDEYEIAKCGSATCLDHNAIAANGYTNLENYLNAQ